MVNIYINQEEAKQLSSQSRFQFKCHSRLACFNQCCQKPTIILKPYDIIRLRKRLKITSGEFLERYTTKVVEEQSFLPLVMLDIDKEEGSGCPFLETEGCGVYEDRPGACRLFPITQGSRLSENGLVDNYFCKHLDFCQGFIEGQEWTLVRWKANQGLEPFDKLNRQWLEIILKRSALNPPAEDARASAIFSMVAYDLDKFRHFVFETPFLEIFEIPQDVAAMLQESDTGLLRFGYKYIKMVLLIEDALQMKEEMKTLPEPADL
jgi:uncharacterized protein